jgi:phosphoglycolate phosphatase-like HAD superfamily hydrolase
MITIIFDLDGTLTDMRPLEDPRLRSANPNPTLTPYPAVEFIKSNADKYVFVFATGGVLADATYLLKQFGILDLFDLDHCVSADRGLEPKSTGAPFKWIARNFVDCVVVGDSDSDRMGAEQAGLPCIVLASGEALTDQKLHTILGQR